MNLTSAQKAQLIGWLNREKDYLLSVLFVSEKLIVPRVRGTLDCIWNDLSFVTRLRTLVRASTDTILLDQADAETLLDVAQSNQFEDRREFWEGIAKALTSKD